MRWALPGRAWRDARLNHGVQMSGGTATMPPDVGYEGYGHTVDALIHPQRNTPVNPKHHAKVEATMRTTKLFTALAATIALTVPAAAAAAPARNLTRTHFQTPGGGCVVTLIAQPYQIASGESAQLFGRLHCVGGADTGQTVTVYEQAAGTPGFTTLGTATTGTGGFYSIVAPKLTSDTAFYAGTATASSGEKVVKVAPVVTLAGPTENSQQGNEGAALLTGPGHRVTFTGAVSPADVGAEVVLQRQNVSGGFSWFEQWRAIQLGVVGPGGVYSISHVFVLPGDANLRVLVRRHRRFDIRGLSNTLSYEISQPENSSLTLKASSNPITDGQTVTLTGKVAGASGAPVTLTAHTDGSDPFSTVATTTTNGAGEYSFVQSPQTSTYYQVDSGSAKSTVQFEGVKYILTASVSTEAVHSGEPVTFSGTVTPVHAGHPVYVERMNIGPRAGFHVVDVGAVSATGTYTITDYLFGYGTGVYRVVIPGDFANQAQPSQTFTITVTGATPSLVAPLPAPALPGEGQV
jgi:hypothetical protein